MEPDDIYWTARAAVDGMPEINRDFAIAAMARAILAERRRCADVARGEAHADCNVAEQIAAAIEAGA